MPTPTVWDSDAAARRISQSTSAIPTTSSLVEFSNAAEQLDITGFLASMENSTYSPPAYPPSQYIPSPNFPSPYGTDPPMAPENLVRRPARPTPQLLSAARRVQLSSTTPANLEPRYAMARSTERPPVPEARIPQPMPQPPSETWGSQPSMPLANVEQRYAMSTRTELQPVPGAWMPQPTPQPPSETWGLQPSMPPANVEPRYAMSTRTEPPPVPAAHMSQSIGTSAGNLDPWLSYGMSPPPQGTFTPQQENYWSPHHAITPPAVPGNLELRLLQPRPQSLSEGGMQQLAGPSTQRPQVEISNLSDIQVLNLRQSLPRSNFLVRPISNYLNISLLIGSVSTVKRVCR